MARPKILVTRRWPVTVEAKLAERFNVVINQGDVALKPCEFRQAFKDYDAVLPTVTDKIGADALELVGPRTKMLANYGVGFTHIDMPSAQAHGMIVTNTPDVLSECTADLAMTLMLMAARRAGEGEREVRNGQWTGWRPTHLVGTKVWTDWTGDGAPRAPRVWHENCGSQSQSYSGRCACKIRRSSSG